MKRRAPGKCSRLEVARPRVDTESVGTPVLLVIALLLPPTATAGALLGAGHVWRSWQDRRYRRAQVTEPIEALGATLRRLHAELETLENQSPGAPLAEIYRVEADLRRRGLDVRDDELTRLKALRDL